jgi:hypothetical protein
MRSSFPVMTAAEAKNLIQVAQEESDDEDW